MDTPCRRLEVKFPPAPERCVPIVIDAEPGAAERIAQEIDELAPSQIAIITDATVARLHGLKLMRALVGAGHRVTEVLVPNGEEAKTLAQVERIAARLVQAKFDRRSVLVALGGGVVGDLAGLCASLFLRGVRVVQLPTTLLAQVDASVGGKTAVNLPEGKNLLGTFWQPALVYIDISTLVTLSPRDFSAGLAEVVKHGVIGDADLFALIEKRQEELAARPPTLLSELVARSCAVKAEIVGADEREQLGASERSRALLNFGHTVGHALETETRRRGEPLKHGEAVALGMIAEARFGAALGGDPQLADRLSGLLKRLSLPVDFSGELGDEVLQLLVVDKKRTGEAIAQVVVREIGKATVLSIELHRLSEFLRAQMGSVTI